MRYEAALAASNDAGTVFADDPRYLWVIETKTQCGIALGYLKSNTRDPVSIGKCDEAYRRMTMAPPPPAPPTAPPPPTTVSREQCDNEVAGIVFFEFDVAIPPPSAEQTLDFIANNVEACGWRGFDVVGHADRAGSDAYNVGLSRRRANAVAQMMTARGISGATITTDARGESEPRVPTPDGVRNPQNRRVEITVK